MSTKHTNIYDAHLPSSSMILNISKTRQIVFRRPNPRLFLYPSPLPQIEQVNVTKLRGVILSERLQRSKISAQYGNVHIANSGHLTLFLSQIIWNHLYQHSSSTLSFNTSALLISTHGLHKSGTFYLLLSESHHHLTPSNVTSKLSTLPRSNSHHLVTTPYLWFKFF